MTDQELLETAAKAAGMNIEWQPCGWAHNNETGCEWNPLTNDGDALRLAVKLELCVSIIGIGMCEVKCPERHLASVFEWDSAEDTEAATRRAIVRAAAAIGKEKK